MDRLVLGLFENKDNLNQAIENLQTHGFNTKDISIVMKDTRDTKDIENATGANVAGGAATGATTGAVVGGIAGFLAGTIMPALGGFLIGGPIGAALGLTGAAATTVSGAATGAVAGGLLGALMGLGVPKEDAKHYETRVKEGAILLAVPTPADEEDTVRNIFEEYDAADVRSVSIETSKRSTHTQKEHTYASGHHYQFASTGAKGGKKRVEKDFEEVE